MRIQAGATGFRRSDGRVILKFNSPAVMQAKLKSISRSGKLSQFRIECCQRSIDFVVPEGCRQYTSGLIFTAQMGQLAKQRSIRLATSQISIEFQPHADDTAENQNVRVEKRKPANVVEGVPLASKGLDFKDRDSTIARYSRSTISCRSE